MTTNEFPYLVRAMINPSDATANGIEVKIEITIINEKQRHYRRIPTGCRIDNKDNWSYSNERVKKTYPNATLLNNAIEVKLNNVNRYLTTVKEREYLIEMDAELKALKDFYPTPDENKLIDWVQEFIEQRAALKKKKGSVKDFITLKGRLEKFELVKGKRYSFDDINLNYSRDFIQYLLKNHHGNTAIKTIESLISVLTYFYERRSEYNISVPDVFKQKNFKTGLPKKVEARPLPLTENEFIELYKFQIDDERLSKTKDRFLIQCCTGFRNSDLFRVKPSNIVNKKDKILEYSPEKTSEYKAKNKIMLVLNDFAWELLEKYKFDTSGLAISNQKYNDAIKDLMKAIGITTELDIRDYVNASDYSDFEKRFKIDLEETGYIVNKWMLMSSHNGRDTFITRSIEVGIDLETIMQFTGQTKYEMMRKYINTSTEYKIGMMKKFNRNFDDLLFYSKDRIAKRKKDDEEWAKGFDEPIKR